MRSTDGGATWRPVAGAPLLLLVAWADGRTVVGLTAKGRVRVSADAGLTWRATELRLRSPGVCTPRARRRSCSSSLPRTRTCSPPEKAAGSRLGLHRDQRRRVSSPAEPPRQGRLPEGPVLGQRDEAVDGDAPGFTWGARGVDSGRGAHGLVRNSADGDPGASTEGAGQDGQGGRNGVHDARHGIRDPELNIEQAQRRSAGARAAAATGATTGRCGGAACWRRGGGAQRIALGAVEMGESWETPGPRGPLARRQDGP